METKLSCKCLKIWRAFMRLMPAAADPRPTAGPQSARVPLGNATRHRQCQRALEFRQGQWMANHSSTRQIVAK